MSEDADESSKTEDPTSKKLDEAHKQGQFAMTREAANWLMVAAMLIILISVLPGTMKGMVFRLNYYFENLDQFSFDRAGTGRLLLRVVKDTLWALWLPILLFVMAGILATLGQTGFHVSWQLIAPKFGKLNPLPGLMNMFKANQLVELLKSIAKLAVVGGVAYLALKPMFGEIETFIGIDIASLLLHADALAYRLLVGVLVVLTFIAAGDFLWQKTQFDKKMKMTKQEVKDEHKQQEGDPVVKGRIRQIRFERARKRMMAAVPSADVVVTNPTHFAVALKYDPDQMGAPMVLAKGVDQVAFRIREIAESNNVPVIENPPLARALYAACDIDEEVPSEHYRAVAEVITYVFKLKGRSLRN
ncbi:flagellar biosynthesis protein FlhB [Azospirillum picis]|uniref:Flagellar biosynthetic protein FlhB n=1 Tax=Azospirillum picis TaxID=488438 RepID=A0ABU0MTG5_9PROT|nr:flagellar biosynthesis protein FlhB [Azospirillum picis]MBP2303034.1 flagellar biosynthetic protein FlhB [Azospirillum picis]MDQ0536786.1 flagellar biosynthetic protein FlhB [Azospirillum picis]